MEGKVCLVTGANAGIGFATALGLAEMGAEVVMACRSRERGEAARAEIAERSGNPKVHLLLADLASQAQIRELAGEFREQFQTLQVLVNNAAIIPRQREVSEDGLEMQLAVNHLGYFLLTNLLLDVLVESAPVRVVSVSSNVHQGGRIDFANLQSEGGYSPTGRYAATKLMNVLFTYELARRLEGTGVTANCLHPGVISTQLNRDYMRGGGRDLASLKELRRGAETTLYLATSPEVEGVSGRYFSHSQEQRSSAESYDEALARRLWEVSATLSGLAGN